MNGADGVLEEARDMFRGFHWGRSSSRTVKARPSPRPRSLVKLGQLEAVVYSTRKGHGRNAFAHWEHEFGEEGGRKPTLAMDPSNKRLHIVGGDYKVEDRGIVD